MSLFIKVPIIQCRKCFKLFSAESAIYSMASTKYIDWKYPGKETKGKPQKKKKISTLPSIHTKLDVALTST